MSKSQKALQLNATIQSDISLINDLQKVIDQLTVISDEFSNCSIEHKQRLKQNSKTLVKKNLMLNFGNVITNCLSLFDIDQIAANDTVIQINDLIQPFLKSDPQFLNDVSTYYSGEGLLLDHKSLIGKCINTECLSMLEFLLKNGISHDFVGVRNMAPIKIVVSEILKRKDFGGLNKSLDKLKLLLKYSVNIDYDDTSALHEGLKGYQDYGKKWTDWHKEIVKISLECGQLIKKPLSKEEANLVLNVMDKVGITLKSTLTCSDADLQKELDIIKATHSQGIVSAAAAADGEEPTGPGDDYGVTVYTNDEQLPPIGVGALADDFSAAAASLTNH